MAGRSTHGSFPPLNHEITIAGGGLAGLSLGIALRGHDIPVTIMEAGTYPRHRVCGEFISGVEESTLSHLGILPLFSDSLLHHTLLWCDQGKTIHRGQLPQPAIGLSRHALDDRLKNHFQSLGGVIHTGMRARPEPAPGLVWTAGRRPRTGPWIGLKAHVRGLPMSADLEMHAGKNGYAGMTPVEHGWINVCGLFQIDRTLMAKAENLLPAYLDAGGNTALAEQLRAAEWRPGSFSAIAGFKLGRQPIIPQLLCLGDAESMIPPFTGNGMSMAFQAAEIATSPLAAWSRGNASWETTRQTISHALQKRFRRRLSTARLLHPLILSHHGRTILHALSTTHLLPFRPLLSLVR